MEMTKEMLFDVVDRTPFGDLVLIEDETTYGLVMAMYAFVRYARERGIKIMIDDVLDTLFLIKKQLEFLGVQEDFSDVLVIKTGGKMDVGKVVGRIPLETEPVIYLSRYESTVKEVFSEGKYINIVLGLERLFAFFQEPVEFYTVINSIQGFLGNKSRKAFYIIDKNVASNLKFNPIPELEEMATTVVYIKGEYGKGKVTFGKNPFIEFLGKEYEVSLERVLQW
ncbi:hypothetical protein OCC_03077 [Thermococcus litoralis DSM 5473]|uniref:Uncharacterized protein n=1 Tax=Thermococcus litoralis (strain ATCC 51850 / DSM 5473 / JCM 8560 / NS-C) TaxID=523849 RepID=H3ZQ37_THELN|nr:DUF257 family protein [Thermococcus litoralis]EHR77928.1 hypothetical protein OCC_03077 [Thermococcus litoralis DSM 5473]